jgi:hypothetical protein
MALLLASTGQSAAGAFPPDRNAAISAAISGYELLSLTQGGLIVPSKHESCREEMITICPEAWRNVKMTSHWMKRMLGRTLHPAEQCIKGFSSPTLPATLRERYLHEYV